ncbi:MAG: peptidylprolyl isomerase [Candidatus Schekmanbacteria bacterium]|nr:peptidylprolyl isomerase [Candidatus Schekmanbacteria bacterium]
MKLVVIPILLINIFSSGCIKNEASSKKSQPDPAQIVLATVNNDKITLHDYRRYFLQIQPVVAQLQNTPEGEAALKNIQLKYLYDLIDRHLLVNEAEKLNLKIPQEDLKNAVKKFVAEYDKGGFEKTIQKGGLTMTDWEKMVREELLIKKLISESIEKRITVANDEIENYYKQHIDEFKQAEQVRVSQIVLDDEMEALALWEKLQNNPGSFAQMAQKYSLSPEAGKGGDLGYFPRGQMPPEFEETAFSLRRKGEVSQVFHTAYGYHIFQLQDFKAARQTSLVEVKAKIEGKQLREKIEKEFKPWLAKLRSQAKIKINPYFIQKAKHK